MRAPGRSLGIALDMRAQLGNRAEPDGAMRQLGFDRAIRIKRVGHAVDDPGFQDRGAALLDLLSLVKECEAPCPDRQSASGADSPTT